MFKKEYSKIIEHLVNIFTTPCVKDEVCKYANLFKDEAVRYKNGFKGEAVETKEAFLILTKYIKKEKITRKDLLTKDNDLILIN